jgi:nucleotide-binding universal stress UspA family protein
VLEDAKRLLSELMAKHLHIDTATPLNWEGVVVEGETATEVTRVAAEQRVDLIVMYSSRILRTVTVLNSKAEAISRTAPCPVLITHKQVRDRARVPAIGIGFKRILVAYDFSGDSELALTHGLSLAQEFQSELHLIHVLAPIPKTSPSELAMVPANLENAFKMAATRLSNAVPAETHLWSDVKQVVCQGLPYREVLAYAGENNIDLVCVGASGAGFGMWALFGSNADRILRQAACPVLIARPLRPVANETGVAGTCRVAS